MYTSTLKALSKASAPLTLIEVAGESAYNTALTFLGEDGSSPLKRWHSIIGIVTAIVGNILISFALNIQRYAHIRLHRDKEDSRAASRANTLKSYGSTEGAGRQDAVDAEEEEAEEDDPLVKRTNTGRTSARNCDDDDHFEKMTYLQSPYWWAGITLMTIGEAGNFLAYGFAPASIVSPLGVVALISNCLIAPFMLKEQFRMRDFWGVVIATGGAVTVVLSAKTQEKKLGPHEVWDAITRTEFEIYMGVTIALIVVLMWASPRYGYKTILIDLGLVGLFGGYTALSTKGVASMFSSTLWRAFTTPVTYALLAILISTAVMQVRYVNRALQRFDSTQVIPVQFVLFTLSVIMGSAILYRDFEQATAESAVKFAGGCFLTFLGVYFITSGRASHDDDDEEEAGNEDEENIGLAQQSRSAQQNRPSFSSRSTGKRQTRHNADGTVDEMQWSRRSSHISFADTVPPQTPQRFQSTGSAPEILLTKTPESGEQQPETESAPLLSNPWRNTPDSLGPSRHYSSPDVPTGAHSSLLSIMGINHPPSEILRTHSQENPHTHPIYQSHNPPQPDPNLKDRPVTPARTSLSLIMPGPLSSPLSGGLSAVVADTLRRGVDSPVSAKSRRPSRMGIRKMKSNVQSLFDHEDDEDGSPLKQSQTYDEIPQTSHGERPSQAQGAAESSVSRSRARSLSNTLGSFLRGKKGGKRDDDGMGGGGE